jgi:hypothetical protein
MSDTPKTPKSGPRDGGPTLMSADQHNIDDPQLAEFHQQHQPAVVRARKPRARPREET